MKEKYGFVYIWYDRKHKRYYIGSHWGFENDKYICSSRWMRNSYKRRPKDFKRRILSRIYSNRTDTFNKESEWLSLIEECDLGKTYYNLTKIVKTHWSQDPEKREKIRKESHKRTKGKSWSPETQWKKGQRSSPNTEWKKGEDPHNKGQTLEERYGEEKAISIREKQSLAKKGKISPSKGKKREKLSGSNNGNAKKISTPNGIFNTVKDAMIFYNRSYKQIQKMLKSEDENRWFYI